MRIVDEVASGCEDAEVVAVLHALRDRLEAIHQREVTRAMRHAAAVPQEVRVALETLSVSILRTVFDHCASMLRESCRDGQGPSCARNMSELFGLGPP